MVEIWSTMQERVAYPPPAAINTRIAAQVLALRGAQGLTLAELAARSAVSRSMLSLVERGESSATAVVLEKIATGLGVSLAVLFADPGATPHPVSHAVDRVPWRDPQSGYLRCNVTPAGVATPFQIVEVTLPAGATVAYETGARDVALQQQVWVQQGRVDVTVGATTYRLADGDCLAMQLDVPTAFSNPAAGAAHYVVVVASGRAGAARA